VRFSFVIPFFDCAPYLRRAVESVLSQPGGEYELILVDDGSRDASLEVIAPFLEDPRVRLVRQANAGPGAARNRGAAEARGEYVWFLDCDDELLPGAVDAVSRFLEDAPAGDLLVGGHINRSPDGAERIRPAPPFASEPRQNFIAFLEKRLGSFSHGAVVVRRRVFERTRYPEELRNNEDLVFHAQVLALFRAHSLPAPLVRIHSRPDSLRHDWGAVDPTGRAVTDRLFDPALLPPELMAHREDFRTGRRLSLFRTLCNAQRKRDARALYHDIIREHPSALLRWDYLKKYLRSLGPG
jgi:glycosyltransferase involved in cell wall biosynthesis